MTVSIITPTYNHEQFIGHCIRSVLAQTLSDWEMIIVDDGSLDRTPEVVAAHPDPRIRYVRQANKGIGRLSETYNAGLSLARGDQIAILEGDDYWPPGKLAVQVKDFDDPGVVLSFGLTQVVALDGTVIRQIPLSEPAPDGATNEPVGRAAMYMMSVEHLTYMFPVSVVIRRKALDAIGGFQQPPDLPLVDYPTFLRLTLQGRFVYHPEILGFWRRHDDSVTKNQMYLIYDGVQRHIEAFVREKRLLLPIRQEEYDHIGYNWRRHTGMRLHLLGRLCLTHGDWDNARKAFAKSLTLPSTIGRAALSWLGILLSYSRLTMEPLLVGLAKPGIEVLTGPNRIVHLGMLADGAPEPLSFALR